MFSTDEYTAAMSTAPFEKVRRGLEVAAMSFLKYNYKATPPVCLPLMDFFLVLLSDGNMV